MPPVGFEPTISAGEWPQAAHLLKSWVRIPPGAWIFVCCECRGLSGRGLCDELITRPEESYRLCCVFVCDLVTSRIGAPYIYNVRLLRVKKVQEPALPTRPRTVEVKMCISCRYLLPKKKTKSNRLGWDGVVGIVTHYGMDSREIES